MGLFRIILSILFLSFSFDGYSQEKPFEKLTRYFDSLDTHNKFMGSVAISKNGKVIYTKTIGYANFENGVKSNDSTKYRIGSISKTYTAVLIMKAIEEGRLNLNHKLDRYYPQIINANKITIEQLLNHRSGIHNFTASPDYLTWNETDKTKAEMLEIIKKYDSDFVPNSKYQYSNSNYVLLSYILESIYQKPYGEILVDKIINPLSLRHTKYQARIDPLDNECFSYEVKDDWALSKETNNFIPLGAGGLISTTTDLNKFSYSLFTGKLLNDSSLKKMMKLTDSYGYGLITFPFNKNIFYGHTGGIDAFRSIFCYNLKDSLSYSLLSNGSKIDDNKISINTLSTYYGMDFKIPSFKIYKVNSKDLEKYVGTYMSGTFPLKVKIFIENNTLMAQAETQSSFALSAIDKDEFEFEQVNVNMKFNSEKEGMTMTQYGKVFEFEKQKRK